VCKQLERVGGFTIVIPLEASIPFRLQRPIYHLIPITALSNLTVANVMITGRGHGCIIGHAHDVLSQAIQTVMNVMKTESLFLAVMLGDYRFANEFLDAGQWPECQ
jgi:hypothetical protein